ncbi:MAG TPA: hypothetical protein VN622_07405 [Clostridia bacterium]|nr:hypothetical protein [Clostridia bacterium]
MAQQDSKGSDERSVSNAVGTSEGTPLRTAEHVFTNSPHMVALCLTVIGLMKVYAKLAQVSMIADELLAVAASAFLAATVCSYFSLRAHKERHRHLAERIADITFLAALILTAAITIMITVQLEG